MPHTKSQKLISWEVIDKYKTSRGIANFLRRHEITGTANDGRTCPLAIATGYQISSWERSNGGLTRKNLTRAEQDFVMEFDLHVYRDLERK